jgi:hypothetical protein
MNYLLDVNVLVAWGWADHADHRRAAAWIGAMKAKRGMSGMLKSLGKGHAFLPDDQSSAGSWRDWCGAAARTTDAHLAGLAKRHGVLLATLDQGIPQAYLIPVPPI